MLGFGQVFSSVFGGLMSLFENQLNNVYNSQNVAATNLANAENVRATNEANMTIAREANAANAQQAELAYQRSRPDQQMFDMMQAGLSKAAAANKIAGGGSYSPFPAVTAQMQPANAQAFLREKSNFGEIMSRAFSALDDIPSNMLQREKDEQALQDMRQIAEIRQRDELRKQEEFDYDLWTKKHGKKAAEMLDSFASKVVEKAAAKNYDLSQAKTTQQIIRDLDLERDPDYVGMPAIARRDVFDAIKSQNDQRISQEMHEKNVREMDDKHKINIQTLQDMKDAADDYNSEKDARRKEYLLRELSAAADVELKRDQLSLDYYRRSLEFKEDGTPKFSRKMSERAKRAWDRLADTIGIGVLRDLLSGLVHIAK